jgi:hypothetical protein
VRIATSALTVTTTVRVAFWAKAAVAGNVKVRIKTAANVLVQSVTVALTTTWTRHDVAFTVWSTAATSLIEWIGDSGAVTLDLAHVVGVFQPSSAAFASSPAMIPLPGAIFTGGVSVLAVRTMAQQFTAEGEMDATFACLRDETTYLGVASACQVATATTNAELRNARELAVDFGSPSLAAYSGTYAGGVPILIYPLAAGSVDVSKAIRLRGRWRRSVGLPEDPTTITAGVLTVDGVTTTATDATALADDTTLAIDNLRVGAETTGQAFPGVIARVRFMAGVARL